MSWWRKLLGLKESGWKCPHCGRSLKSPGESIGDALDALARGFPGLAERTGTQCSCGAVIPAEFFLSERQPSRPEKVEEAINQWYDAVLDKQTSERAAKADEAEIRRIIEELASRSCDTKAIAAETLAKIGEPAVPYLIEAIQVRDDDKFVWGTEALDKMGRKANAAIPTLQRIANDPMQKESHRRRALDIIGKIR